MQTHRGFQFLRANRRRWRVLLLCGLAVTWWPVSTRAADADWLWQNPRPTAGDCRIWRDISFLDSQTGMAVHCGGAIIRTDNGGATWFDSGGDIEGRNALGGVSLVDASTATVVGVYGVSGKANILGEFVARTTDGGVTWTEQTTDLPPRSSLTDVFFTDADTGVAVGENEDIENPDVFLQPIIIHTSNGGSTWTSATEVAAPPLIGLKGVACVSSSSCTAVGSGLEGLEGPGGYLILGTEDGGVTWDTLLYDDDAMDQLYAVVCPGADICITVGGGGTIFRTIDGGITWTPQDSGTNEPLNAISCADSERCLVVGGGGGDATQLILRTDDGGASWIKELSGPSSTTGDNELFSVAYHGDTDTASVGGWGAGGGGARLFLRRVGEEGDWERHPQFRDMVTRGASPNEKVDRKSVV